MVYEKIQIHLFQQNISIYLSEQYYRNDTSVILKSELGYEVGLIIVIIKIFRLIR